jgi:hypothetical protein
VETITVAASRSSALGLSETVLLVGGVIVVVVLISMVFARLIRARRQSQRHA